VRDGAAEFSRLDALDRNGALKSLGSALIAAVGPNAEVLIDVELVLGDSVRRDHVDLLIRDGSRISFVGLAWTDQREDREAPIAASRAVWPLLQTASDAFGEYARVVLVTRLDDRSQRRVERQAQRRSAGAARLRVLGRSALQHPQTESSLATLVLGR
jgi:hypothetical protein